KKLLAGTGCAKGCSLELIYETDDLPWSEQASVLVQHDLADIGIKVKLVRLGAAEVIGRLFGDKKYDLCVLALFAFVKVPAGLLAYALQKDGGLNSLFSGYDSPKMNALMKTATEQTGPARLRALKAISNLFLKDQPFATLTDFPFVYASRLPKGVISIGS